MVSRGRFLLVFIWVSAACAYGARSHVRLPSAQNWCALPSSLIRPQYVPSCRPADNTTSQPCQAQNDGLPDETRYFDAKWHERRNVRGGSYSGAVDNQENARAATEPGGVAFAARQTIAAPLAM